MQAAKHVILGGGMVAGYAAKQYFESGGRKGDLAIISADDALPYERPPLSKSYLAGKDNDASILISQSDFYRDNGVEVRLTTRVQDVDFDSKLLKIAGSEDLKYERLVIATGAAPRKLDCPGNDLPGVFYLRSMDDSRRIREHAAGAKKAVIIGGGFIGMEVASVLAQKGLETTLVFPDERIWKSFFSPELSALFRRYYEQRGVRFVTGGTIAALKGNGRVEAAETSNGASIECDLVVAGIGVTPVTGIFKGVTLGNGVVVNDHLEASASGVYAAGDVANYTDVLWHKQRRVEHWDNAVSQGQYVARALLGERAHFVHVPYFFSDVFDLSYEFWGDTTSAMTIVHRGDLNSTSVSAWWLGEDNRLLAAFTMNRPDEERESAPQWIEKKRILAPERLGDAGRSIQDAV